LVDLQPVLARNGLAQRERLRVGIQTKGVVHHLGHALQGQRRGRVRVLVGVELDPAIALGLLARRVGAQAFERRTPETVGVFHWPTLRAAHCGAEHLRNGRAVLTCVPSPSRLRCELAWERPGAAPTGVPSPFGLRCELAWERPGAALTGVPSPFGLRCELAWERPGAALTGVPSPFGLRCELAWERPGAALMPRCPPRCPSPPCAPRC